MNDTARRLHPATILASLIRQVPRLVILFIPALGAPGGNVGRVVIAAAIAAATLSVVMTILGWMRFSYRVEATGITIERGVFSRTRRSLPFERIQDIAIERGPLARAFGTAIVRIDTGGGGKDEGLLDMVALDEAERLRDLLRDVRVIEETANEQGPPIFAMSLGRVLLAGLHNFSLVFIAVIVGALQYLRPLLGDRIPRAEDLITSERLEGASIGFEQIGPALLLLGAALLLGVATGVFRTLMTDYRFTLREVADGLRRSRGLMTLSEVLIPIPRVQLAVLSAGPVMRLSGWQRLELQTLGEGTGKSGRQAAAPFASADEIATVLATVHPAELPDADVYARVSKRSILRSVVSTASITLVIAAALVFAGRPGLWLLLLIPLATGIAALRWSRRRWHFNEATLFVRAGLLTRRLWIVPVDRVQSVDTVSSRLQRALGLVTLKIDTAGASGGGLEIVDLDPPTAARISSALIAANA